MPALDELVAGMAPRTALLVLDNCEHLLDAVAALVQAVMQDAPNVAMLSTSQEPLHLPAEQQYRRHAAGRAVRDDGERRARIRRRGACSRPACAQWTRVSR